MSDRILLRAGCVPLRGRHRSWTEALLSLGVTSCVETPKASPLPLSLPCAPCQRTKFIRSPAGMGGLLRASCVISALLFRSSAVSVHSLHKKALFSCQDTRRHRPQERTASFWAAKKQRRMVCPRTRIALDKLPARALNLRFERKRLPKGVGYRGL